MHTKGHSLMVAVSNGTHDDRDDFHNADGGEDEAEFQRYCTYLNRSQSFEGRERADHLEEMRTTPLFTWPIQRLGTEVSTLDKQDQGTDEKLFFDQFAVLGSKARKTAEEPRAVVPLFLNTNAPWSAFICGSQGSGKSYTLSCMLENCLYPVSEIGRLPQPLSGIVFHYDNNSSIGICEAASLCAHGIKVNVLVSPSNHIKLKSAYAQLPGAHGNLEVIALKLQGQHLDVSRILSLMAFSNEGKVPLYMEACVIMRILRELQANNQANNKPFDFNHFVRLVEDERFSGDQRGPLNMRLDLLKSFMASGKSSSSKDIFDPAPGTLTIVDLTDPFVDPASACGLFDMCLALFLKHSSNSGKVIALDEAHKFMTESAAADGLTASLLETIRQQRHNGSRTIIATQEPTISPTLLDLCTMTFVHRFTSPAWLLKLRGHLAAASAFSTNEEAAMKELFEEIVDLSVGESLVFAPSAMLEVRDEKAKKLGMEYWKMKTRKRVTEDRGMSKLAVE